MSSERVSRDFRPYYRHDGFAVQDRQVGAAGCFGDFPSRDFASFGKRVRRPAKPRPHRQDVSLRSSLPLSREMAKNLQSFGEE